MVRNKTKKKSRMDHLTAQAFAQEAFEKLHPPDTWPAWLRSHSISSIGKTAENDYVVNFSCKPKNERAPETFFTAVVDCWTSKTTVIKDTPLDHYNIDDLEPYG